MDALDQAKVNLVADFIDTTARRFHPAFGTPAKLDMAIMQYETQEIYDLKETLDFHHKVGKYVDFTRDLNKCTWDDVHEELAKAQAAAERSEKGGKQLHRKLWRTVGTTSSILAPGLAALPDNLCILHGGLALLFSVSMLLTNHPSTSQPLTYTMLKGITACTPQRDEQTADTRSLRDGAEHYRNGAQQGRNIPVR
jgi:hypothetical protein